MCVCVCVCVCVFACVCVCVIMCVTVREFVCLCNEICENTRTYFYFFKFTKIRKKFVQYCTVPNLINTAFQYSYYHTYQW